MATGFEEGSGVKGGTGHMATHATGALPLCEGPTGRADGRRRHACMPADLAEGRIELEPGLRTVQEGGAA